MTQRKFRWGILGAGKIAGHFARDLALIPHAELFAISSRSQARADEFAAEFHVPHAFDAYEKMLTSGVDAVYIATRHPQHCELAIMCLDAEIPVLCEKPLAINSRQVQEMTTAARRNSTFLMEAIWTRFMPTHERVFALVEAGEIGDLLTVKADFGFTSEVNPSSRLWAKELAGGSLLDIGIYPLFLAQTLLGVPNKIHATAAISETGVDAETLMTLNYPKDKFALLHSTLRSTTECTAEIFGTLGSIKIHNRWHEANSFTLQLNNGEKRDYSFSFENGKGYIFEIRHVMDCVRQGKTESPLLPLIFSENLMKTMDAVRREIGLVYEQD